MARVFLGLGSNVGDRLNRLGAAVGELRAMDGVRVLDASPVYHTEPWPEPPGDRTDDTSWFLNCVVEIETTRSPADLLAALQGVEARLGRVRRACTPEQGRYEPRTIDIDMLLYGDTVVSAPDDLHIPHLLMHERAFVLRPLADLAPHVEHPVLYETVSGLLEALGDEQEVRPAGVGGRWFGESRPNHG